VGPSTINNTNGRLPTVDAGGDGSYGFSTGPKHVIIRPATALRVYTLYFKVNFCLCVRTGAVDGVLRGISCATDSIVSAFEVRVRLSASLAL
jgi:hypothetical protein